jgi:hypothetical protein
MNEWRSLRELLEQNSPAVIASAIERHGVFVYDRYNRVVKASPESNDNYSQAKALDLIADWQAELSDPSPTYSWEHPRFELEDHPTQRFGWPAGELPNFIAQIKAVNPQNLNTPKKMWIKVAQQEALVILSEERKKGIEPKQDALAKEVAKTLSSMGVRTSRGDITWENIKREALAGEWWRKTRQRPHI